MSHETHTVINDQYENWYSAWLARINGWTMDCGVGSTADVLLLIPELVTVMLALSSDQQVPQVVASKLESVAINTMRGIEFLPEDSRAIVALVGDAMKIAKELQPLINELPTAVIERHWQGQRPLANIVNYLLREQDTFLPRC